MLSVGHGCFVHFPDGSRERILHPAKIVCRVGDSYTVECEEPDLTAEDEQHLLLFYEARRSFVQHPVCVETVAQTEPYLVFDIRTTANPVSAQSREFYRVSTIMSDTRVEVGPEQDCELLDVSVTGLSIAARGSYNIGRILIVRLDYDGEAYTGTVRVQGSRPLNSGRTRYGLLCIADVLSGENLQAGLRQVTMNTQRRQLQRLSRAT